MTASRLEERATELRAEDEDQLRSLIERETKGTYRTPELRAAYRAGLSTAAAICDAAGATFGARPKSQKDMACKGVAHGCGDAIMRFRELVEVNPPRVLSSSDGSTNPGVDTDYDPSRDR